MKHPSGCFFHSVVARRYTSSIAHKLLAFFYTNSAFALRSSLKPTPSAMESAYAPCAYLANSEHYAKISTNTCLLLNAKTRMANSPTTPPLRCFLFRRWSIAARNYFAYLVPPNTNYTLFCSPGKIPQAECAYHQRWYLASCGEESHPRTQAARLPQTSPRIANSPTLTIFKVASPLFPQVLLRVCRSGYYFYLTYSVFLNIFQYLRAGNIPLSRYAPEVRLTMASI